MNFYSRPCGRGDSTARTRRRARRHFYSRPCGRGDGLRPPGVLHQNDFYSRPCGRGDGIDGAFNLRYGTFLLTPLREGRPTLCGFVERADMISTHAPAGGATIPRGRARLRACYFYSRPCGRGDELACAGYIVTNSISTHAPAGGATAIFHKSVMRFCGKLPKDDTVLCLASFGFPRRDPKAVYLAWISCANLPQKCVRQGLALKDQGTSCFHEGLASHAFDPVLV